MIKRKLLLVISLTLLSACQTVSLPVPEGFAYYEKASASDILRAVSPERVIYRVHRVDAGQPASLDFWTTALLTQFKKSGYIIVDQQTVKAGPVSGVSFVMATTYNGRDYSYSLNVFVQPKNIILIEAAGENSQFKKYQRQLAAAIAQTDLSQLNCTLCQIRPLSVKTAAKGKSQD